jgi:hypothetical protein
MVAVALGLLVVGLVMLPLLPIHLGLGTVWEGAASARAPEAVSTTGSCLGDGLQEVSLSLDGVPLSLCTSFLPAKAFIMPEPDNSIQVATAVGWDDSFKEFSITAIPFGTKPSTEDLPTAQVNGAKIYRTALEEYRKRQGGSPQTGPTASLFGQQVAGSTSIVNLNIDVLTAKPVLIVEWVVEAGSRLWIIRASQEIKVEEDQPLQRQAQLLKSHLYHISLTSVNLDAPSTSFAARDSRLTIGDQPIQQAAAGDLPFPSWWNGDCDTNNYYAVTGISAYPLGTSYRAVKACGPRPYWDGAPDVLVQFFSGAWGEYEWECVELSMRFMYLAYGIHPYPANGKDVVPNYSGDRLDKINNGTSGRAPQPSDILSYGPNATWGHTSVVIGSNVDGQGNGTITIMEQNGESDGNRTHTVTNWYVQDNQTISGWLHDSSGGPPPPCPQSGGVILYKDWHYDCGGEGEGRGYVRRDGTGWQNVGGDFDNRASSVRVPSGWSVKLFEHPDLGGGWACRSGDDDNFSGDDFNNGLSLNDNVSSFEVFHDSRCGEPENRAPNTPSPESPGDWHVAHDGRAPFLCWSNPGDPDGDSLEFYAEVYESAVNANSGWICTEPLRLDSFWAIFSSNRGPGLAPFATAPRIRPE